MVEKVVEGSEPLWDVRDVSRYLRASRSWIYKAAERGHLPTVRVGALLRFVPEDIRRYVSETSQGGRR